MTWITFILALAFGAMAGAAFIMGRVASGKARAFYSAAGAVGLIQALAFGVIATYPSLQIGSYVAVLAIVGIALVAGLAGAAAKGQE